MTATTLPPLATTSEARLAEVERQITQIDAAITPAVYGWAEELQDERRRLLVEAADLLDVLGRDDERRALLRTLALAS